MTSDGGGTWAAQITATGLYGISCASATVCVAVGNQGLVWATSNGGSAWSTQTINSGNYLSGVSCPSPSTCFAVGFAGAIYATSNGGTNWSAQTSGTTSNLYSISCPSTSVCVAVGAAGMILGTTNAGTSWIRQFPSQGQIQSPLTGVSCATVRACSAVGFIGTNGVFISTTDGISWSFPSTTQVPMTGVGCAATQCVATGINGDVFMIGQNPFGAASTSESGALFAVSCPAQGVCFAAGDYGIVVATSNGGTGWKTKPPSVRGDLSTISCPSISTCFVGGHGSPNNHPDMLATTDGGATWLIQTSITQVSSSRSGIQGVSCPSPTTCYAVDFDGFAIRPEILKTTDGGVNWSVTPLPFTQSFLFAISCPSSVVCYAIGDSGLIVATTDGVSWRSQSAPPTAFTTGISCPTVSVCFASVFNGGMLTTTNGGAQWTAQPIANQGWRAVSCPTTSVCFGVGDKGMVATTNGGSTWTSQTPTGVTESFSGVSCSTITTCVAVTWSGAIFATTDGTTWKAQASGTTTQLNSISCPTATVCFATGKAGLIIGTTNGGTTAWNHLAPTGPSNEVDVTGFSCLTSTSCFAIATPDVFATTNAGVLWSSVLNEPSVDFTGISCPATGVCFVTGKSAYGSTAVAQLFGTTDGGATWSTQLTLNSAETFVGISCPGITTCYAVASQGNVWATGDGWKTWHEYPVTSTGFSAISCPSTTVCFAADNVQGSGMGQPSPGNVFSTTNGGINWNLSFSLGHDTQAGVYAPFGSINCPSATTCYAGSQSGLVATTNDGGANWRTEILPLNTGAIAISCPSPSTCFAGATNTGILRTNDFGTTWDLLYAGTVGFGISCPSAVVCFAGGLFGVITQTANGGTAWAQKHPAGTSSDVHGLTCSGASCYAVAGETLVASHDSGATWTTHVLSNGDFLVGIACPAANTCVAVGWPGAIYLTTDSGANWTYQSTKLSKTDETLVGVSCSGVTACVAVGTDGIVLSTFKAGTWSVEQSGTAQPLTGVSCPDSSSCVAVGLGGLTLTRSGGIWHGYSSGTTANLHGISCPTASSCDAVGDGGVVITTSNGGAGWTAQNSGTPYNLYGVQCLQPGVCLAAGSAGTAVLTEDGTAWSTLPLPTFNSLRTAAFTGSGQAEVAGLGGTILANPSVVQRCTSAGVSANPPSPQTRGAMVAVKGTSTGCPVPQYEFWLQYPNGTWVMTRAFSQSDTWSWDTGAYPAGNYVIHVWANQSGDSSTTWQAFGELLYAITTSPPCATASLAPANPTQATGTTVNFMGSSTVCTNPQYEFWIKYPNGTWYLKRGFGAAAFNWSTVGLGPGTYTAHVWANQAGDSTATLEAYGSSTVTLTGCGSAALSPASGSSAVGAKVTFTASSTGCGANPVYEFWLQYPGGSWYLLQKFTPGVTTWQWNTAGYPKGNYVVHVWANNQGSDYSTLETYGIATYTLT